uniref:Syndecan n=2 Tax=Equus caballus TaxID=9796 RepID=A0A3Q2LK21_HORSE
MASSLQKLKSIMLKEKTQTGMICVCQPETFMEMFMGSTEDDMDLLFKEFNLWRAELTSDKDMYLDNSSIEEASGVYPIDDDDYASASGSGADEDIESPELTTSRPLPKIAFTSAAPKVETTTLKIQNKIPAQTKSPEEIDKEKVHLSDSERNVDPAEEDTNVYTEKHSDNLFKRTEVLAAVIAGGVIGFLFAIFLILLLVYRMRKKDEGSYDLGERKPSSAAYQKAPTKEFYA